MATSSQWPTPVHLQLVIPVPSLPEYAFYAAFVTQQCWRRYLGFLAAYLWPVVRPLDSNDTWGVHWDAGGAENLLVHQGYHTDELNRSDWFVYPSGELEVIENAGDENYFEAIRTELAVPNDLERRWLDLCELGPEDRLRFERASAWLVLALRARARQDPSAAVLSAVSAIECLFPDENEETCSECGQRKYSVNQKYRDFLERLVRTESKGVTELFLDTYRMRSQIVHGQFLHDVDEPLFGSLSNSSFIESLAAIIVARRGLRNWISERRNARLP